MALLECALFFLPSGVAPNPGRWGLFFRSRRARWPKSSDVSQSDIADCRIASLRYEARRIYDAQKFSLYRPAQAGAGSGCGL